MGKKTRRSQRNRGGGAASSTGEAGFKATTPGLEDVVFTSGTTDAAAVYEDVVKKLNRHLGQQPWKEVSVLSTALASLEPPVFTEPVEPVRQYWTNDKQERTTETRRKTDGTLLKPVDDAALHAAKYQAYVEERKTYKAESSAWKENRTRAFMLFTAHCPEGLLEELKQVPGWDKVAAAHDAIGLLNMLRDHSHGKKEKKQGTMAKVEADMALLATQQVAGQTLNQYAKLFNA